MARKTESISLPITSPGTIRHIDVWRWGKSGARPKVYIQSALHADEWPGIMASHHLCALLDEAETKGDIVGEIVMLPYANPIGLSQSVNDRILGRFRLADGGGNFNRDWPDLGPDVLERVRGKLGDDKEHNITIVRNALLEVVAELPDETEKDAHRKALLGLSVDADFVLDLHCDWEATLHLYSHAEHSDITMELACDMGVPVVLIDTGLVGGPFDECNANTWMTVRNELGLDAKTLPPACYATTIELRGQCDVSDELGSQDAANIYRFMVRRGIISGEDGELPNALCTPSPLDGVDMFTSPREGMIAWKVNLGDTVKKGDLLAELIDITESDLSKARTALYANQNGLLFSIHTDRLVRPGTIICKIAGHEPLAHRKGAQLLSN